MSNIFWKNFHMCFSNFKCIPIGLPSPPPSNQHHSLSSIHPKTSTLINNFNSLYDLTSESTATTTSKSISSSSSEEDDNNSDDSPPDFATIFASQRFFFSSPGSSNSILESPESPPHLDKLVAGSVSVPTYSPDPYADFRKSMQEMVEAREFTDVRADWDFLHELLSCYLSLNPKNTHKFILTAFSDLIISLMSMNSTRLV